MQAGPEQFAWKLAMLEAGQIIGCFSALLLVMAVAAWAKLLLRPVARPLNGIEAPNVGNVEIASRLIASAVGLSAVAAFIAVAGLFAR
jgi:hypothetical protein